MAVSLAIAGRVIFKYTTEIYLRQENEMLVLSIQGQAQSPCRPKHTVSLSTKERSKTLVQGFKKLHVIGLLNVFSRFCVLPLEVIHAKCNHEI